jgi:hypothetical protein
MAQQQQSSKAGASKRTASKRTAPARNRAAVENAKDAYRADQATRTAPDAATPKAIAAVKARAKSQAARKLEADHLARHAATD